MEMGAGGFDPYFDPDFDSFSERINPPRICVDNDACDDYTLVKVDSANKHGILLEMVQVLTDLDLLVSKSYISSDGGWFMDVFHVTDQMGKKITDPALVRYIEQSMVSGRAKERNMSTRREEIRTCLGRIVCPRRDSLESTTLELIGSDRPGLLSEISAVLADLDCDVGSAEAWSHESRVAMVMYLTDNVVGEPISDPERLRLVEEQVRNVVGAAAAHDDEAHGSWHVRLVGPTGATWVHTERRLHQMMREDRDRDNGHDEVEVSSSSAGAATRETKVSIECCWEKEYSVVNVKSRDRPKLLFDTVCTLTDMKYVVFHATVSSKGHVAHQEYFIRRMDGHALDSDSERRRVARCLVAAIERRPSHGLRFNVCGGNRTGLLSDVTRVFREQGLSLSKAEIGTRGDRAVATFFVTDTAGGEVNPETVDSVRKEIGGRVELEVNRSPVWQPPSKKTMRGNSSSMSAESCGEQRQRFSLGSLLWSGIERFSHNFGSIRS